MPNVRNNVGKEIAKKFLEWIVINLFLLFLKATFIVAVIVQFFKRDKYV